MTGVRSGNEPTRRGDDRRQAEPAAAAPEGRTVASATYVVQPTVDLRASFLEAMREFVAETGTTDADGHTMAELEAADFLESYTRGLCDGTCRRFGVEPLRCCEWWLVETGPRGRVYLGRVSLRHHPGRGLGHLDFAIRPSRRREGHGTTLLSLALPIARANGVPEPVLVGDEDNVAARRAIEANGGRPVKVEAGRVWYRITPDG